MSNASVALLFQNLYFSSIENLHFELQREYTKIAHC